MDEEMWYDEKKEYAWSRFKTRYGECRLKPDGAEIRNKGTDQETGPQSRIHLQVGSPFPSKYAERY